MRSASHCAGRRTDPRGNAAREVEGIDKTKAGLRFRHTGRLDNVGAGGSADGVIACVTSGFLMWG